MADVVMLDSGGSNLASVQFAFERLGVAAALSRDPERIRRASHVVLPGVGAAGPGMARLRAAGLDRLIPTLTQPVLGVCLGMQLLFQSSAEGDTACLGILAGRLERFDTARCGRVPHMGWNRIDGVRDSPLLAGLGADAFAYFVHSYAAPVTAATVATCDYGGAFAAVVSERNFHGAQFHPERSALVGARLLANFLELE
ncbi:MAG: imidazole glycerol phosphate synthase subunit HisH [Xanthomonadales bacterium]|nr:imidazole glycerol phosphate synthase subunit HisH [Xanthomonadales bacterium]